MKYRLLVDIATDRLIWYTTDLEAHIQNDEHSAIAEFEGTLPEGITLGNCWNYGFRNKEVILLNHPAKKVSLLESNRTSIRKFLVDKINEKRSSLTFNVRYADYVEMLTYNDSYCYNGTNLKDLPWLQLASKNSSLTVEQLVEKIKFDFNIKRQALYQTEELFLEMNEKITNAQTNDELFDIRTAIFERIGKI
jgi:hypothetical protein